MKYITKQFKTMREAERYLNRLYNKYDHAVLINFPRFSEEGNYTFEVK